MPIEDKNRCPILLDFLPIECMLSLDIFRVKVFSSSVLYLSTRKKELNILCNRKVRQKFLKEPKIDLGNLPMSFLRFDSFIKAATSVMIFTASNKFSRSS